MTLAEYATTSGVILELPGDIYVNAPVFENFTEGTDIRLVHRDDGFLVETDGTDVPADPVPVPEYVLATNDDGVPYQDLGVTHTDRIRISPIAGCAWRCTFCDLPYEFDYRKKEIEHLVEVVRVAAKDPVLPAHHATVSGGTPKPGDVGYLHDAVTTVAEEVDMPVDVMMVPREDPAYLEQYRDAGVDGLFLNAELVGQKASEEIMPQKAHLMKPYFLDAIDDAVGVFGAPKVRSLVILGLEPVEDTLTGVEELAERGCVPVLSPFRPAPATPLSDREPPGVEEMETAWTRTVEICADHDLKPGPPCTPCQHNTLTFPDETAFYHHHGRGL